MNPGDILAINNFGDEQTARDARWLDMKVVLVEVAPEDYHAHYVRPLSERPDGFGLSEFYWPKVGLSPSFEDVSLFGDDDAV
jgi:hypothetical protein